MTTRSPDRDLTLRLTDLKREDLAGAAYDLSVLKAERVLHTAPYHRGVSGAWSPSGDGAYINYVTGSDETGCDVLRYSDGAIRPVNLTQRLSQLSNTDLGKADLVHTTQRYYLGCDGWTGGDAVDVSVEVDHRKVYYFRYDLKSGRMQPRGEKTF